MLWYLVLVHTDGLLNKQNIVGQWLVYCFVHDLGYFKVDQILKFESF